MKKKASKDPEFERFWDAYGMKLDRAGAERAWRTLSKSDRRAAIDGIQHYREICETLGVRRMYAQGYLNHRRWEDEYTDTTSAPTPAGAEPDTLPDDLPIW